MTPNEIHTDIIVGQGGCKGLCFVEETKTCCWGGRSKGWKKQRCNPPPPSPPPLGGGGGQPTQGSGCLVGKTTFPLSLGGGEAAHKGKWLFGRENHFPAESGGGAATLLGFPRIGWGPKGFGAKKEELGRRGERQLITRIEREKSTQSYTPSSLPPPTLIGGRGRALAQPPPEAGGLADCPLQPPDWRLLKGRADGAPTPRGCI